MGYRVALIGSSGGGSATISSGESIIQSINHQLSLIRSTKSSSLSAASSPDTDNVVVLSDVLLIVSNTGLDFKNVDTIASLWVVDEKDGGLLNEAKGDLRDINKRAKKHDQRLAIKILKGEINAVISISSDPNKVNEKCILAAIEMNIPVVGTGGTSISTICLNGANVIGSSGGSVATTSISRGISFAASLSSYWKLAYFPSDNLKYVKLQAIIGASVPILLISSLSKFFISKILSFETMKGNEEYLQLLLKGIKRIVPTVITMISCQESSQLNELSMISGAAVGSMSDNDILVSIVVGVICGWILTILLTLCSKYHFLPTSTTIISIGLSVIISGGISIYLTQLITHYSDFLQPTRLLWKCNDLLARKVSNDMLIIIRGLIGSIIGYYSSIGSEYGYYHTIMLPLIALDMQFGNFSLFGCYDLVTLCVPCCGVCGAIFVLSYFNKISLTNDKNKLKIHSNIGYKGFCSNFLFGDFVESCYPYSLDYPPILKAVRISSVISGALLGIGFSSTSAYLPIPLSLYIIPNVTSRIQVYGYTSYTITLLACIISFSITFITTIIYFFKYSKSKQL